MPLNKSTGNMFKFVTHTWNIIKGACPFDCTYCYMKRWGEGRLKAPRLDKAEMKTDLGRGNFIFIGSSIDMFAPQIPEEWITHYALTKAIGYENKYLLQTKNPRRYLNIVDDWLTPKKFILSATIETNYYMPDIMQNAPPPLDRAVTLAMLPKEYKRMVTIEPIMKFDLDTLLGMILTIKPVQINIGADSCNNKLPEPSRDELLQLIGCLEKLDVTVELKSNLNRILEA